MRRNKMKPGAPAKVELNKALERIKKSNNRQVDVICPACGYKLRTSVKWAQRGFPTCSCGTTMEFLPRYEDRVSQVDLVVAPAALPINGQADATVREVKTIAGQIARLQDKLSAFLEAGLDRTSVQVANVQSQIDNLTDKLGALADA